MNALFQKILLSSLALACCLTASAQLPNEKFGKPSKVEWEYQGWGDAIGADAIILCKTMKVSYQLSAQVLNYNWSNNEVSLDNIDDFSNNQIDDSNILVLYEFNMRTKILKPDGARHANIDITYFSPDHSGAFDELSDLKVKVFTKNAKGKVEKRTVNSDTFVKERVNEDYVVVHVVVPDVQAGSIVEYQYNIVSPRAAFIYDWVFQETIPTVRSKCDIDIPAFLQFKMNAPINKLVRSSVVAGHLAYDANRSDMKKAKSCPTNHYTIVGDYILPEGHALAHNQGANQSGAGTTMEKIGTFTSLLVKPAVAPPARMPDGHTHLSVSNRQ